MAFMTAGSIKLADPLKEPLGGYQKTAQSALSDALGKIGGNAKTSQIASGRVQGSYQPMALARAGNLASRGIDDSLGSVLGGSSLKDAQNEQEFQRNMALAKEVGDLNSPSVLQQVLGGLGGGANTALQFKGLYDSLGKNGGGSGGGTTYGLSSNPYSTYDLSKLPGYSPYDYNKNWGG